MFGGFSDRMYLSYTLVMRCVSDSELSVITVIFLHYKIFHLKVFRKTGKTKRNDNHTLHKDKMSSEAQIQKEQFASILMELTMQYANLTDAHTFLLIETESTRR